MKSVLRTLWECWREQLGNLRWKRVEYLSGKFVQSRQTDILTPWASNRAKNGIMIMTTFFLRSVPFSLRLGWKSTQLGGTSPRWSRCTTWSTSSGKVASLLRIVSLCMRRRCYLKNGATCLSLNISRQLADIRRLIWYRDLLSQYLHFRSFAHACLVTLSSLLLSFRYSKSYITDLHRKVP